MFMFVITISQNFNQDIRVLLTLWLLWNIISLLGEAYVVKFILNKTAVNSMYINK